MAIKSDIKLKNNNGEHERKPKAWLRGHKKKRTHITYVRDDDSVRSDKYDACAVEDVV